MLRDPRLLREVDGPTYTQMKEGGWHGTQSVLVDVADPVNSKAGSQKESQVAFTAGIEESYDAGGRKPSKKKKKKNAFLPLIKIRKAGPSIAFLLFVGLLVVSLERHIRLKKEEEKIVEKEPLIPELERTKKRFKKIEELLPAAERLASVIGTTESRKLFEKVQGIVEASDWAISAVTEENELRRNLKKALGALRRLHDDAVEQGSEIFQANESKYLHLIPPLEFFMSKEGAAEVLGEEETRSAVRGFLIKSYQGLYDSAAKLRERFNNVGRRLLTADGQFGNEEDGEMLTDAALVIECLRTTTDELQGLSAHATQLKKAIHLGIQTGLMAVHEETLLTLDLDMQVHQVYAVVAQDALKRINDSPSAHPADADKIKAALNKLETDIERAELMRTKIHAEVAKMRECRSLSSAVEAAQRAAALQAEAKELSLRFSGNREAFADLKLQLSLRSSRMLNKIAEEFVQRVKAIDERTRRDAGHLISRFPGLFRDSAAEGEGTAAATAASAAAAAATLAPAAATAAPAAGAAAASPGASARPLSPTLMKNLLRAAEEIAHEGDGCVKEAMALQERAEGINTVTGVSHVISSMQVLLRLQAAVGAMAWDNVYRLPLIKHLEEEIERLNQQTSSLHAAHLSLSEKQEYAEAKNSFSVSRKAAEEANSLGDAIEAVHGMRRHATAMTDIFYKAKAGTDN